MPTTRLDEVDFRLLKALKADGRTPLKELARLANASVPTIRARLHRLRDMGIIKLFTVAIDEKRLVGATSAFISLRAKTPELRSIAQDVTQWDEVTEAHLTSGEQDLILKVSVPDMRALEDFLMNKLSQIPGVESSRSSFVIETVKEQLGPALKPGFGVRLFCAHCRKEIMGEIIRRTMGEHEFYFCCTTCASVFEEQRKVSSKSLA